MSLAPLLIQLAGEAIVRHVPQPVDLFARRGPLCGNAPSVVGAGEQNDARRSVAEALGTMTGIDVHQFGPAFGDFAAVQAYLRRQFTQRPRAMYRYVPWAEPTPLTRAGIVGTLHFSTGASGAFEATDVHLCAQDGSGVYWWFRLTPMEIWPPQ